MYSVYMYIPCMYVHMTTREHCIMSVLLLLFILLATAPSSTVSVCVPMQELMEGMEGDSGEGGGIGALEKLANKLNAFLNECKGVQVQRSAAVCYNVRVTMSYLLADKAVCISSLPVVP